MLDEKAFFATINRVAMWNLQTYGMAVSIFNKSYHTKFTCKIKKNRKNSTILTSSM
jgi:hypothetical protein